MSRRVRWVDWRITVIAMLAVLLVVLPYYLCYRALASIRERFYCFAPALLARAPARLASATNILVRMRP